MVEAITDKIMLGYFKAKCKMMSFFEDETGDTNIIAIILLIVVVIAMAIIFRDRIKEVINSLFNKVDNGVDGFSGTIIMNFNTLGNCKI